METLTFRTPRLVALILLVMIMAGLSSFIALGRQEDPTITNLFATATTQFPGADPARVEALVTAKIEEELRKIAEIEEITSVSRTGTSTVSIELVPTLGDAEIEQVWTEARDAIEAARAEFPAGVLAPEFNSEGISAYSAVIAVSAEHDGVPLALLSRHAETLADRLRNLPATRAVDRFGVPDEEVLIVLDPVRVAELGLTAAEVSARIAAGDGKVQAGRLQDAADLSITISGEIKALDRLGQIVLRENTAGTTVTLADVARIERGVRAPASELALADGRPAVLVGALAQEGVQIDVWMGKLRDVLAEGQGDVPLGISERLLFDQSTYTVERLQDVAVNMGLGVGLIVVVLFFTLGARGADCRACSARGVSGLTGHSERPGCAAAPDVGDRADRGPGASGGRGHRDGGRGAPQARKRARSGTGGGRRGPPPGRATAGLDRDNRAGLHADDLAARARGGLRGRDCDLGGGDAVLVFRGGPDGDARPGGLDAAASGGCGALHPCGAL